MQFFSVTLLLPLLLTSGGLADAATYYVALSGRATNTGTVRAPFRTIQQGVRRLRAGDTLIIRQGEYPEMLIGMPSGKAGTPTIIQGAPGERVLLKPVSQVDQSVWLADGSAYITLDNLILDGNAQASFGVVNNDSNAHHIVVRNLEIRNHRASGILLLGTHHEIRQTYIHHNGQADMRSTYAHGIYFQGSYSTLAQNVIHDNASGYGIQNFSSAGANPTNNTYIGNVLYNQPSGGLWISQGSNHLVANNVIFNTGGLAGMDTGALVCCGPGTKVYHNVVAGNGKAGILTIHGNDSGAQVRNNIAFQNPSGNIVLSSATQSHNMTSNPGFVNPVAGDFRLTAGSSAIDAGMPLADVPRDRDELPRPQGQPPDVGAYEYRGSKSGP